MFSRKKGRRFVRRSFSYAEETCDVVVIAFAPAEDGRRISACQVKIMSSSFPYWDSLVTIGKCIKPHGLHGEIRVKAITDFPERFEDTESVFAHTQKDPVRPLEIESARPNHGGYLIKFVGVDNLTQAESLRAHFLSVPQDALVELEEDEYWHWELEGLRAFSPEGEEIGILKEVVQSPAHDLYLVETLDKKIHWVPAVRQYVPDIDIERGRVVLLLPDLGD